jgi:transcriptional regulator with XRE-family HTH domain
MAFVIRKLQEGITLGEKLREMRQAAHLTLSELAEQTKIQKHFLEAFEKGRYESLPAPLYARQYLKTLVQTLGGDTDYYLELFEKEHGTCDCLAHARLPRTRTHEKHFRLAGRSMRLSAILIITALVCLYLGSQMFSLLQPPVLTLFDPKDGFTTSSPTLTVSGQTQEGAILLVNEQKIVLEQGGIFHTEIILERGVNIIAFEARNRYSRPAVEYRRVIFEPE